MYLIYRHKFDISICIRFDVSDVHDITRDKNKIPRIAIVLISPRTWHFTVDLVDPRLHLVTASSAAGSVLRSKADTSASLSPTTCGSPSDVIVGSGGGGSSGGGVGGFSVILSRGNGGGGGSSGGDYMTQSRLVNQRPDDGEYCGLTGNVLGGMVGCLWPA